MSKIFLNRIKSVLAEKNISSKTLAAKLHVSETTVSGWCTNSKQPSLKTLYEIAEYLKIDVRQLLVGTNG
jgi:transcriptional regulator with XRE-family HTH domain